MFLNADSKIECAKPSFAGISRLVARPAGMRDDPKRCAFCAIASVEVLEDGVMAYPLFLELDDVHLGPLVAGSDPISLSVTAFAEVLRVWADEAAYASIARTEGHNMAMHSLIPSGTFSPDDGERPPRAEAILTGVVTRAERRLNRHSGAAFDWCTIETLAAHFDVVAGCQERPFERGNVLQGTFWLIARRG